MVVTFASAYPEYFAGPADAKKVKGVDYNGLKTYEDWDAGNGKNSLAVEILEAMPVEKNTLDAHIKIALADHYMAKALCTTLLKQIVNWWRWFKSMIAQFHQALLHRACLNGACSRVIKASVWQVCSGTLQGLFDKLRTVTVGSCGAHLVTTPAKRMGLFHHPTLQQHRILKHFEEKNWVTH
mmetsp:Transcript_37932/g.81036  ORF Transcript_37932/g.81036 Transcript_37932/m.81036 type:complete len:182 (+) Transcript_37932:1564-2109(+)